MIISFNGGTEVLLAGHTRKLVVNAEGCELVFPLLCLPAFLSKPGGASGPE